MNQNQIPSPTVLVPAAAQKPASNTAAVQTLAADGSSYKAGWTIPAIICSYDAIPTTVPPSVTIAWTDPVSGAVSEVYFLQAIAGIQTLVFPCPKHFPSGSSVVITLTAGGTGIHSSVYADSPILEG